ncbi:hypothetical protein, partial [Escherichia coli]|uniref:hypothetical protein n=1 Tax=Escherichia coli TaxID=562 RepID=UPI0022E60A92
SEHKTLSISWSHYLVMDNPGPLAALMFGFVMLVLLIFMFAFYFIGRSIKNKIISTIFIVLSTISLILIITFAFFIIHILQ